LLTPDSHAELESRATLLLEQLATKPSSDPKLGISPKELAKTVIRTLGLPEIAKLRPRLVPEQTVFGSKDAGKGLTLVSGIADAIAYDQNEKIEAIVDWKSDVHVSDQKLAMYRAQLSDYKTQTGAEQASIVLMTTGVVLTL
jgi:hypothetical protein